MNTESLLIFFIISIVLVGGAIVFSTFAPKKYYNPQKFEPYECGIPTIGVSWMQFNVGYYSFAILYLIFDVEVIFLFPWATALKTIGVRGLVEILIFFFILGLGLIYAWKKNALKWE